MVRIRPDHSAYEAELAFAFLTRDVPTPEPELLRKAAAFVGTLAQWCSNFVQCTNILVGHIEQGGLVEVRMSARVLDTRLALVLGISVKESIEPRDVGVSAPARVTILDHFDG